MNTENQIKTILKNILYEDSLNIYVGNRVLSNDNFCYIDWGVEYYKYNKYYNNTKYIGVYWLCYSNEVVYIGYSKNLISRISSHTTSSSDKVWDKVKIILFDDEKIARSVERTLLLNIQTKYNDPNFNKGYTVNTRYKSFKSKVRFMIKYYNLCSSFSKEEMPIGCKECINNIDFYKTYANMSFEEYEENFNLKLKGLKHNLLIT